jgi:urea carboxylase-associated protein 2
MNGKDPSVLWEEILEPGATWSHVLKRGTSLRLVDVEGGANVSALFFNFECPAERYNMPDTLKAQHIARLTHPCVLYSDMGRVLCSITADTVGWHDTISGHSNAAMVKAKYGTRTYQEARNGFHRNAHDSLLIELEKWGLSARDLHANASFFSKVTVDDTGGMHFVEGNSKPGSFVELRAEMNVLTILNSCQHPLDPDPEYRPRPVSLSIRKSSRPMGDDPCRKFRPENERGFTLTERYFL